MRGQGTGARMSSTTPSGDSNLYAPPVAEVGDIATPDTTEFYVVASRKFFLLFFLTVGLYQIYWFYRHWAQFKRHRKLDLWPIPRAIFAVFFTHSLAREIEARIHRSTARFDWSPGAIATTFVILQIASNILDRMAWRNIGFPVTDWISIGILLPMAWLAHAMQRAANVACGDPDGASNAQLTAANWIWMLLGGILWALALLGLLLPQEIA